jgi:hypothetical protein
MARATIGTKRHDSRARQSTGRRRDEAATAGGDGLQIPQENTMRYMMMVKANDYEAGKPPRVWR